jgi:hypothetical protein
MVRELVGREFGVRLSEASVGRLLRTLGLAAGRHPRPGLSGPRWHPVHRPTAVKQFAASTDGRLRLWFLPGYSPELNPDEWVWKHVKHDRLGRAGVSGPRTSRQGAGGAAPAAEAPAPGAGLLPRSQPAFRHRLNSPLIGGLLT